MEDFYADICVAVKHMKSLKSLIGIFQMFCAGTLEYFLARFSVLHQVTALDAKIWAGKEPHVR